MSRHTGHFKTNFSALGVIEAERQALKVAPSKILLSAIAAICRKSKKMQNFVGLSWAHFLSYHFDILHGISYITCDFRYLKIFPKNQFLGTNIWGGWMPPPHPPRFSESLKTPSLKGLRRQICSIFKSGDRIRRKKTH